MSTLSNPIEVCVLRNNEIAVSRAVVSDSVLYERIKFTFPESWEGYTKTAVFRNGDITLSVILNGDSDLCVIADECYIPHEVIKFPEFTVSVFGILGDSRVTTPQAAIRVIQSGYGEGDKPSDPTPTEYQQLINLANETKQIAQSVRDDADSGVFKGEKGDDGYTPQKGVDYFTDEDIAGLKIPSVDQKYLPNSENAQSGKAVAEAVATVGGQSFGHWETVMDIVWDFNDYIHIVSYDPETHIFTCNSGELDWATVGERLTYAIAPVCDTNQCKTTELPFNNFREFSGDRGGGYMGGFVRLSDTEFTFKDTDGNIVPVPNETTMDISKFHFEHLTPRAITNLNCTKARYTVTDLIHKIDFYCYNALFDVAFGDDMHIGNLNYSYGWNYRSGTKSECEIIGDYVLQSSETVQYSTGSSQWVESSVKNFFVTKKINTNQKINSLTFEFNWQKTLPFPRNGGLFKLERWVE